MEIDKETKDRYTKYLEYQSGLLMLWMWLKRWNDLSKVERDYDNHIIKTEKLSSKRFGIGQFISGGRKKGIFVGLQKDEMSWFKKIKWRKIIFETNESNGTVWFISHESKSPDEYWPDLPAIAFGISVDPVILDRIKSKKISVRSLWDDNGVLTASTASHYELPIKRGSLESSWPAHERTAVLSFSDLILKKLSETSVYEDPGFKGSKPETPEMMKSWVDFKPEKHEKGIESTRPDLFGQFLDADIDKNDSNQ